MKGLSAGRRLTVAAAAGLGPVAVQKGQALVEYAILLLVMLLLVAGGLELSIAAYNSYATKQAAEAGASFWTEKIQDEVFYDESIADYSMRLGLGDHNPSRFRPPSCAAGYDDGLPYDSVSHGGDKVYLFNPLAIDISACGGSDAAEADRSKVSVLLAGGGADQLNVSNLPHRGLPAVNRALYALYQKTGIKAGAFKNNCQDADSCILKLPGYAQSVYEDPPGEDPTGYVVSLAKYSATATPSWSLVPTMRLMCLAAGSATAVACDTEESPQNVCWAAGPVPLACDVEVQVRYRHVFETFVLMGMEGDYDLPADLSWFNDSGATGRQGWLGSELTNDWNIAEQAYEPGLKVRKDFLGCYRTNSAMRRSEMAITGNITFENAVPVGDVTEVDATITTDGRHGFDVGRPVTINGTGNPEIDGVYSIVEVLSSTEFVIQLQLAETPLGPYAVPETPAPIAIGATINSAVVSGDLCDSSTS